MILYFAAMNRPPLTGSCDLVRVDARQEDSPLYRKQVKEVSVAICPKANVYVLPQFYYTHSCLSLKALMREE